jgi:hypothetical protein
VRESGRIQLPFEVEVSHPTLGRVRSVARDISEGGIFVALPASPLKQGARVRLTVLTSALIESTPTPTIEMEVARVTDAGMGLKFSNQAGRHLWNSVRRLRDELDLGRDYFQVFQAALVTSPAGKLLVLQQNGRWLFPGQYLVVGQDWKTSLVEFLDTELGIVAPAFVETIAVDSSPDVAATENATVAVFHRFQATTPRLQLNPDGRYRHPRWIERPLEVEELSFTHASLRAIALQALRKIGDQSG